MKLQSATEFLSMYGFMFLILAAAIVIIAYIALDTNALLPSHCTQFSGLNCNYMSFTYSSSTGTSTVLISLTNSQSVPVNVISFGVILSSATYPGSCSATYIIPGNTMTCTAVASGLSLTKGQAEQGEYVVNAGYCNSDVGDVSLLTCNFEPVTYGGSFLAYATPSS